MAHDHDEHREGFAHDLPTMQEAGMVRRPLARRGLLGLIGGGAALATLAACGGDDSSRTISSDGPPSGGPGGSRPGGPGGAPGAVSQDGVDEGDIPEETNGPYPADGTNGVNVLTESGIVRSDIRSSFGAASGVAAGVPLTVRLKVYDHDGDEMVPFEGAAVYIWQCDREGLYSLYSQGVTEENYLRGVQEVAKDGSCTFTSIFPACYEGRWPHIHFEVYPSLDAATTASDKLRTSQIAFPEDVCTEVFDNAEGYEGSQDTFSRITLASDNVFSDGHALQMAKLTGSIEKGYTLKLAVPV